MADAPDLMKGIENVHATMRSAILRSITDGDGRDLRLADDSTPGDTIYGIDRVSESILLTLLEIHLSPWLPLLVVAEGLPDKGHGPGIAVVPAGTPRLDARFRVIVDPIDGTRGLMYGKRSAWILTGIAPEAAGTPTLRNIDVAVQTEVPPPKQLLADTLRAVRGGGASADRTDLRTGETSPLPLAPSTATSIEHGFGQVMRAFPGGRDVLAAIDDDICRTLLGQGLAGKALAFEDQYLSTGGQLAELAYGHDRWAIDIRPLLASTLRRRGLPPPLCCHPYDICTALIAQEAGILVTTILGEPIDAPLILDTDIAWAGYANTAIRDAVQPALRDALRRHGLVN